VTNEETSPKRSTGAAECSASTRLLARKSRDAHVIERATRTVLVIDVVESARLIEQDEESVIARWLDLAAFVKSSLLPAHSGRLVKHLGDGMLVDFEGPTAAVAAAFAVQEAAAHANVGIAPEQQILLRIGIEEGEVAVAHGDIYGHAPNLASRLAGLADPGGVVVSARARDRLTDPLDADIEDLGECHLKHIRQPVRAFRLRPPGPQPRLPPCITLDALRPILAVIPFNARQVEPEHQVLGEVLAEEVIRSLSRSREIGVISRLSTSVLSGRGLAVAEIGAHLNAHYVLSGVYRVRDQRIVLDIELAETGTSTIVWAERLENSIASLIAAERELVEGVVEGVANAVILRELQRARLQPLPTLQSYTLLLAAITLMHRQGSPSEFERSRQLLEALIERFPRQAIANAWLANWHVLRVQQGWSSDSRRDGEAASDCTRRALDVDPDCSLALAIDGLVNTNLLKRLDVAEERYSRAIETNPNDGLAWLLKGTMHAFRGEGPVAVDNTQRALRLSPLDPQRYFIDSLAATACNADCQFESAIALCKRSLKANRRHTSTLRTLAIAQWELGRHDEARTTGAELLRLEPGLTLSGWLKRSPSADFDVGQRWKRVLQAVGVPN
jgi:adenylate cyclase